MLYSSWCICAHLSRHSNWPLWDSPQSSMKSITGKRLLPSSVSSYSLLGGSSEKIVFFTIPCSSSSHRFWSKTLDTASGISQWIWLGLLGVSRNESMMHGFHFEPITLIVIRIPQDRSKGSFLLYIYFWKIIVQI